ncbi:unnamed protein product [Closterium sp. NIES-65]|nr:unnamed protein product [Closterium sp. NIES-65]
MVEQQVRKLWEGHPELKGEEMGKEAVRGPEADVRSIPAEAACNQGQGDLWVARWEGPVRDPAKKQEEAARESKEEGAWECLTIGEGLEHTVGDAMSKKEQKAVKTVKGIKGETWEDESMEPATQLSRLLSLTLSLAPWAASSLLRSTQSLLEGGSGHRGGDDWEEAEEEEREEKEVTEEREEYMRREGWQEKGAYKRSRVGAGMWSSSSNSSSGDRMSSETFNPYSSSPPSPPAPPSSPSAASALASKLLHLLLTDARISAALLAPLQSVLLVLPGRGSVGGSQSYCGSEQQAALHRGLELLTLCIRLKPFCHAAAAAVS